MHNTRGARRQKRCEIRTCLRLSGPLHRTSTSRRGGEAPGTGSREPYPCPRQGHGSPPTSEPHATRPHPAPVAQWIEQAPSKRLAAGSSPAGGTHGLSPAEAGEGLFQCPGAHRSQSKRLHPAAIVGADELRRHGDTPPSADPHPKHVWHRVAHLPYRGQHDSAAVDHSARSVYPLQGDHGRRSGGQAFTVARDGHRLGELIPLRRRRRFVPRAEFVTTSRTAPDISPDAFRNDQDAVVEQELDDPYGR